MRLAKVPEVTALFWIIKIATTGMGEAASDWMGERPVVLAAVLVLLALAALVGSLWAQFRAPHYVAWIYWSAVAMVSVVGTMVADVLRMASGLPLWATSAAFALAVAASLGAWYRSEGNLSIHSITTRRRETYYWTTVASTFALGTALGDYTALYLNLGWLDSGLMFLGLILLPLIAWRWFGLNSVAAFWAAYVLTRPLGASFADWFGVPKEHHGLGVGTGPVALVLIVAIVALVGLSRETLRPAGRPVLEASY
ncbi:hypothetical protein ACIB24_19070 [Spongisporangium articulatum]|uniref:Membrane-anchored protein n=1 Tax=Spongisporangium articulatum TaxID=3362603 RepID=A0ABW8AS29_9ACTN